MGKGSRIAAACLIALLAGTAWADFKTTPPLRVPTLEAPRTTLRPRVLSFRSLAAQVDNQVIANLLTDKPALANDIPLSIVAGEVSRCESQNCAVPLTIRVSDAEGPVTIAFAVANPEGELSEVHHAECGTGACSISLVLERGANTISVGVIDGLAKATAYTTFHVNANRKYAKAGRTEWF